MFVYGMKKEHKAINTLVNSTRRKIKPEKKKWSVLKHEKLLPHCVKCFTLSLDCTNFEA